MHNLEGLKFGMPQFAEQNNPNYLVYSNPIQNSMSVSQTSPPQVTSPIPYLKQEKEKRKEDKINSFIFNLYKLLEDVTCRDYIFWLPEGKEFGFHSLPEFGPHVLSKHYRSSNEQSFTRQLNMYGFIRLTRQVQPNQTNMLVYYHPFFMRGRTDLLCKIKRGDTSFLGETEMGLNTAPDYATSMMEVLKDKINKLENALASYHQQLTLQGNVFEQFYMSFLMNPAISLPSPISLDMDPNLTTPVKEGIAPLNYSFSTAKENTF
ncbi:hypothetical protein HMI56_001686 [Coelomomyces lativittatus]|nr:hypothetical protein HMI56_001686 [Coelomomyces lativittatus]